jgi:uncharacterized membrane protein YjfL (UPF0719 family)
MRVIAKIVVTIVFLIAFVFLYGVINTHRQQQGYHTAGPIGSIIVVGLFLGLFMIWSYKGSKKGDGETVDKHKLDKE